MRDVKDQDGAEPTMCKDCSGHQGQLEGRPKARAESHERIHLAMIKELEYLADSYSEERDEYRRRARSALESRGRLADRLLSAAEEPGSDHTCSATKLAYAKDVHTWAMKQREIDDR